VTKGTEIDGMNRRKWIVHFELRPFQETGGQDLGHDGKSRTAQSREIQDAGQGESIKNSLGCSGNLEVPTAEAERENRDLLTLVSYIMMGKRRKVNGASSNPAIIFVNDLCHGQARGGLPDRKRRATSKGGGEKVTKSGQKKQQRREGRGKPKVKKRPDIQRTEEESSKKAAPVTYTVSHNTKLSPLQEKGTRRTDLTLQE